MSLKPQDAAAVVENVRLAHRVSVAFYQRLLPRLAELGKDLGLEFWYWEPAQTSRPCRSSTAPTSNWAWDMVPLFASRHAYWQVQGGPAVKGDVAVMFEVYLDDAFKLQERKRHGVRGEPDPLALPVGRPVVDVSMFRCKGAGNEKFESIWNATGAPDAAINGWQQLHTRLEGCVLSFDLVDLISNPNKVANEVRRKIATA